MADPRDYIMQGAQGLSAGLESLAERKRNEDYLNTELPEPAQHAFNQMLPQPMPVASYAEDVGAAAGGLGRLAGGQGAGPLDVEGRPGNTGLRDVTMQPSQAAVGMEHPEIKAMAEKVARGEIDPKLAAAQMRRFTNRDVPGLKLALDAREQEARMRQASNKPSLSFEQQLLLAERRGVGAAEARGGAQRDVATITTGGRVKAAEIGAGASNYRADKSAGASNYRADRAYEAAKVRAESSERTAHQRFGTKNSYVNDSIKNLKIKADAVGKAGSQLDILRNLKASGSGVDPDRMKKAQDAYDAAQREYNAEQKRVDELLKNQPQQPQQYGGSSSTERTGSSARAGATGDFGAYMQQQGGQAPFAIRQSPGQPPPPGMEGATPVAGPPPPNLPTRTEVQEPPAEMNQPFVGRNGQPVRALPVSPQMRPPIGQPQGFQPPPAPSLDGVGDVITRVAYSAKTNTTYFFSGNRVVKTVPGKVQ